MDDALFAATVGGAGAALGACSKDCGHVVDDQYPPRFPALFEQEIASSPIALFGWNGCPCTGKARAHFQAHEYCYMENVWQDPENKLFEYLQCRYGEQHHSFIFVGGQVGDVIMLDMPSHAVASRLIPNLKSTGLTQNLGQL